MRPAPILGSIWLLSCGLSWADTPQATSSLAASVGLFAYPSKGQTAEQQKKDETECYDWSKQQSGFDPAAPPPTQQATAPPKDTAPAAKGAARGAAAGAVAGEVASDDAGQGAKVGAVLGARRNRIAQVQQQRQAELQAQADLEKQKAARAERLEGFKRGMSVCLEARGYAVK